MRPHPGRQKALTAIAPHPVERPQITARRTLQQMVGRQRVERPVNQKRRHRVALANLFIGFRFARITAHATRITWFNLCG